MRKLLLVLILIIFISNVSALGINEIEINPVGGSSGKEWIELYNDDESDIDISEWEVWEGIYGKQGPKLILSIPEGTIIQKGSFYIIEWGNPKLNNGGDFVILYDSNGIKIDETEMLDESESGVKTWQLCDSWEFKEATKGEENSCEEDEEDTNGKDKSTIEELSANPESKEQKSKERETIILNPQVIKSEDGNENLGKSNYAIYGLVFFCALLVVLFVLRKNKYNKNEFR